MSIICTISQPESLDDVYLQLKKQLSLPSYFGHNLDALYDVLCIDLEGPITVNLHLKNTHTEWQTQLIEMFSSVAEVRADFHFNLFQ